MSARSEAARELEAAILAMLSDTPMSKDAIVEASPVSDTGNHYTRVDQALQRLKRAGKVEPVRGATSGHGNGWAGWVLKRKS